VLSNSKSKIKIKTKPQLVACANGVRSPLESDFMIENFSRNLTRLRQTKNISQLNWQNDLIGNNPRL
jgi:hypothetical protein